MTLHTSTAGPPIRAVTMEPEVFRQFISAAFPTPGVLGVPGGMLVTAPGSGMSVNIAAGSAIVPGVDVAVVQGNYSVFNDAPVNAPLTPSNPTNPRIDLVILTVQDAYYQGAVNAPSFQVIAGTPAGSPVAPSVPVSFRDCLILAQVAVAANAVNITSGNITDKRVHAGPYGQLFHAKMYSASGGAIAGSTAIPFDTIDYDPNGNCTTGAGAKYTVPADGYYIMTFAIAETSATTGVFGVLRQNGTGLCQTNYMSTIAGNVVGATTARLTTGDVIQLASGPAITMQGGEGETFLSVHFLSPA